MKKLLLTLVAIGIFAPAIEPVLAGEWDFYGSARIGGWYWYRTKYYQEGVTFDTLGNVDDTIFVEDTFPKQRVIWDLQHNSRFGVKAKGDRFGFGFELGWGPVLKEINIKILGDDAIVNQRIRSGLLLRRLFGEWYINEYFTLLVGHEWAIANIHPSNQAFFEDAGLTYCGALYTGRRPQVKISCGSEVGEMFSWKAEFALIKPDTFIVTCEIGDMEPEEKIPKIEGGAECELNISEFFGTKLKVVCGVNAYDLVAYGDEIGEKKNAREPVRANCIAGGIDLNVWKTRLSFVYAYGKNLASYGVWIGDPYGWRFDKNLEMFYPKWGLTDTADNVPGLCNAFTQQGALVFNIKPLEWLAWEIGAGLVLNDHEEYDLWLENENQTVLNSFKRWAAYTNFQFEFIEKHILIVPEFSFSDFSGRAGKWYAAGLKIQLDM